MDIPAQAFVEVSSGPCEQGGKRPHNVPGHTKNNVSWSTLDTRRIPVGPTSLFVIATTVRVGQSRMCGMKFRSLTSSFSSLSRFKNTNCWLSHSFATISNVVND